MIFVSLTDSSQRLEDRYHTDIQLDIGSNLAKFWISFKKDVTG